MHGLGGADDGAQNADARFIQLVDGVPHHRQRRRIVADHKQHRFRHLVQAQHIGRLAEGRRVDDHVLIPLRQLANEFEQGAVQVDGVALQHGGQQVQIAGQGHHRVLHGGLALIQGVQGPAVVHIAQEHPAQTGVVQVQVNEQDLLFQVGHLDGQIGRDGAFALALLRRGDVDAMALFPAASQPVTEDVRCRREVLLDRRVRRGLPAEQLRLLSEVGVVVRDDAQQLQAQAFFHALGVQQGRPCQHFQQDQAAANGKACQAGEDPYTGVAVRRRGEIRRRPVDHRDRADHQRLGQHLGGHVQDGVHQLHAGLRVHPPEGQLQDLGLVVAADAQVAGHFDRLHRDQARLLDGLLQHAVAVHHIGDRIRHILGQLEVAGGQIVRPAGKAARRRARDDGDG